jgi:hypothetical protein
MTESLEPNEAEESAATPLLSNLLNECLIDIESRVNFLHVCWTPTEPEIQAQRAWCLALGVLSHEMGLAIVRLISSSHLRAAKILGRSLMEYQLRLSVYREDSAEALKDVRQAPKELRRFLEGRPTETMAPFNLSAEATESLEAFVAENKGKPQSRNISDDIKRLNHGNQRQAQFEYLNLYGLPSAFVHGSGLVFQDILLSNGATGSRLAWRSELLTPFLALSETTIRSIKILELIEETSGYFQANKVLWRKYHNIIAPWAQRFEGLVKKRSAKS